MLNRLRPNGFSPSELQICQRVFDRLCAERRVERSSGDAEDLAVAVINVFNAGLADEDKLLAAVTGRFDGFQSG